MLTRYPNKMLACASTKAAGPPPPDSPWGKCAACGAVGPIGFDRRKGRSYPSVVGCRCLKAPPPTPIDKPPR